MTAAPLLALLLSFAPGEAPPVRAFTGATLLPIDGPPIENGTLLIRGGKVAAVGEAGEVDIPDGAETVDLSGKTVMPGLVCTHSHVGGPAAADGSGPVQPGVRVLDSLNPFDTGFKRSLAGGLTTLNVMPGSGHLISGETLYLKLRYPVGGAELAALARGENARETASGRRFPTTIDDLLIRSDDGTPLGGLKMANGTNSLRGENGFPGTRGKSAFLVRQRFYDALEYRRKLKAAGDDDSKKPPRDLHLETLLAAMDGTRVVHHHTHRADDIMTVLRLSEEFGFPVVLHHVSEGWKVADEIKAAGATCSVIVIDSPGGKLEARDLRFATGAILEQAGVPVAFHTDDPITDSRLFFRSAALAVRAGMSREGALRALTQTGADMLGLGDRVGSLSVGKDADFVVLSGDPLSVYTTVEQTWVEGRPAFDRSDDRDRLYAEGGYGAGRDQVPTWCCYGR